MKRRNGHGLPTPAGARPDADHAGTDEPEVPVSELPPPEVPLRELRADLSGVCSDTLTLYLRDVRRTTLFTAEE